ncbi:MAG TPA: FecR family protein, partial [bacterium]
VKLFDGSELKVDPKTTIGLSTLQKPSDQDKVMKFKLFLGKVFASVQKLASSKSSFEIEAGGVVCGVRGTQFTMGYDPGDGHVQVFVQEGTVFTDANGNITIVPAGHGASFTNGNPDKGGQGNNNPNGNGNGNGKENGNDDGPHTGLNDLNHQFTGGILVNGDNSFTDPAVGGGKKVTVNVRVLPGETVP